MSKKVDIKSGSFSLAFNVNGSIIWTQFGLFVILVLALLFVKAPNVRNACLAVLILDGISIFISFLIGLHINVQDSPEAAPSKDTMPVVEVGTHKSSTESTAREVAGSVGNKAPLPNPSQVTPVTQQAPIQQQSKPAPQPQPQPQPQAQAEPSWESMWGEAQTVEKEPEPEQANDIDSAVKAAGLEGKEISDFTDDEWRKLFS